MAWKVATTISPTARWMIPALWPLERLILDDLVDVVFGRAVTASDYADCSVFVIPDEMGVTWGRTVVEAMSAAIPVVATGTNQEFIVDGVTGFLVAPNRPELLAARIQLLLNDDELRVRMGKAALARANELFSDSMYAESILDVFNTARRSNGKPE